MVFITCLVASSSARSGILVPDGQHNIFMLLGGFFRPLAALQGSLPHTLDILVQVLKLMLQKFALAALKEDLMETAVQLYQLVIVALFLMKFGEENHFLHLVQLLLVIRSQAIRAQSPSSRERIW